MFSRLGNLATKYAIVIVLAWLVLALTITLTAPSLSDVSVTDESKFLPHGAESVRAKEILREKFPEGTPKGSALLVLYTPQGWYQQDKLNTQYTGYVEELTWWLESEQAPEIIERVVSVTNRPDLKEHLVSPDNTTMFIRVELSEASFSPKAEKAVEEIRQYLANPPQGLEVYATGEAPLLTDLLDAIRRSIDITTMVTIILVVVLLLLIYRSPLASLVPLFTIGLSFLVARGLLGFLADAGVDIFTLADAYLVVMVFGVGTDYCLFIISRFREELPHRSSGSQATLATMRRIGPVIAASATTVIIGFMALMISHLGMDRTLGPAIAIGVAITLVAGLTLTPALMTIMGNRIFWPARFQPRHKTSGFSWATIARVVATRPLMVALPLLLVLLLPYIALPQVERTSDRLAEMPQDTEAVEGFSVVKEHFGAGELMPTSIVLVSPQADIRQAESLRVQEQVAQDIRGMPGVAQVRTPFRPTGDQLLSYSLVGNQLSGWGAKLKEASSQLGSGGNYQDLERLLLLPTYLTDLSWEYPEVSEEPVFLAARNVIGELEALLPQIITTGTLSPEQIAEIKLQVESLASSLEELASSFASRQDAYFIPRSLLDANPQLAQFLSGYFSPDSTTTKFEVILKDAPYSAEAKSSIKTIRNILKSSLDGTNLKDAQRYVAGETAEMTDIRRISDQDFVRVMLLTLAGIFLAIALLLRSVVAPLYMTLTVLMNFGTTLGISAWAFQTIFNYDGISYMIPSLIFVVLVAVGADYNIFLVSRIREESEKADIREAVRQAASQTGGVITACGLILAGTFATLTTAPLDTIFQVGTAVAIGIMVDTFLVRALLIPSIAAMLGKWNWWPKSR